MRSGDVTIAQMGNGAGECIWCHASEVRGGFWEFWRKLVELKTRHRLKRIDFRGLQRPDKFVRYGHRMRWGCRWKSQNRKNVYLSPYVEEPLNSKVIKSFVPELRSCKCFSCFKILYSMYIWYEHSMYVSHIRIMGMVHWYLSESLPYKIFPTKTMVHEINKFASTIHVHTLATTLNIPQCNYSIIYYS